MGGVRPGWAGAGWRKKCCIWLFVAVNIDLGVVFHNSLVWKTMVFGFWLMGRWMVPGKDW